jgi:hypothetical protein
MHLATLEAGFATRQGAGAVHRSQGAALGAGGEALVASDIDGDTVDQQDRHDPPVAAQPPDRVGGQDRPAGLTHTVVMQAVGERGVIAHHQDLRFDRPCRLMPARNQATIASSAEAWRSRRKGVDHDPASVTSSIYNRLCLLHPPGVRPTP